MIIRTIITEKHDPVSLRFDAVARLVRHHQKRFSKCVSVFSSSPPSLTCVLSTAPSLLTTHRNCSRRCNIQWQRLLLLQLVALRLLQGGNGDNSWALVVYLQASRPIDRGTYHDYVLLLFVHIYVMVLLLLLL